MVVEGCGDGLRSGDDGGDISEVAEAEEKALDGGEAQI